MITPSRRPMVRGMGAAACPSLEQLQGVADVNDPCQIAAGVTATGDTIVPPAVFTPTPAVISAIASGTNLIPAAPAAAAFSWFQANPALAIGAGVLLLLLLTRGGRR